MTQSPLNPSPALSNTLHAMGARWGWFVGLGIVLLILGLIAAVYVISATLVSVLYVGILMLIGGIGQLVHAWRVDKGWPGFVFWSLSGLLYVAAGLIAIVFPITGAAMITLILGATLIAAGAFRLWVWFNNRGQSGWQWLAASGLISLLAGLLIAAGWPENSLWILGLLLAIDLAFQGWTLLFLGVALRRGHDRRATS
ncbi:HdeD family acid-resistance protein [Pusillimonas sp. CC-YST705]|uniref:HdeD family acid-resistance protein n=1 Tax=Mesopusillimonas faecipullorum TaxID=2755040 RepID=A0ABS8CCF2_9BURK|nr:HdeD family acid-resistance protein [Mesopusillimonas faecipullorum]MCB5363713.1 HdeD family acid-resistance protein [Mesopusillimonas faecipullorum]